MANKKNEVVNIQNVNNTKEFNEVCKGAASEVKEAKKNLFFFINVLNKLQRKNEFVDGTNLHELGKQVRNYAISKGFDVDKNNPFNAYLFEKCSDGISRYKVVRKVKACERYAISETIIDYKMVTLSETGLINAYKYIIGIDKKEMDKTAREYNKTINKAIRKEESAKRKELRKIQNDALKAYSSGNMCIEEFAEIMKRAI